MYNVDTCPSWEFQSAIKKQRSANHVICGRSALENTMQQNSYSRFPRQLITLSIMWSLYQSNVNWSLRKYKWALIDEEKGLQIFLPQMQCVRPQPLKELEVLKSIERVWGRVEQKVAEGTSRTEREPRKVIYFGRIQPEDYY